MRRRELDFACQINHGANETRDWCLVTGDKPCCSEMSSSYPIRSEASAARRSAKNDCSTSQFVIRSESMVCTSHQSPVTSHQSPVTSHKSRFTRYSRSFQETLPRA